MAESKRLKWRAVAMSLAAACAVLTHGRADAGPVDLRYEGRGKGREVRITLGGETERVFAGQLKWSVLGSAGGEPWIVSSDLRTYCIEPSQTVERGGVRYDADEVGSAGLGAEKASALRVVTGAAGAAAFGGGFTDTDAAAFQLAVWEIVNDYSPSLGLGSLDLGAGRFMASAAGGGSLPTAVRSRYAEFVAAMATASPEELSVVVLMNEDSQDQMTVIPSPAGAGLLCMGAVWMMRRRRAVG